MEPERFYIILREDDAHLRRHGSLAEASTEALRLSDKHPGKTFVILKAKYQVRHELEPPMLPLTVENVHRFDVRGSPRQVLDGDGPA